MIKIPENYRQFLWTTGVVVLTVVVYLPVLNNDFLTSWDDNRYIIDNPNIRDLTVEKIIHLFTIYYDGHYHPLTLLSLAMDYQAGGLNPKVFHLTNLLFHLINVLLVFHFVRILLRRDDIFIPLTVAVMFGIATMHVESVAWAAERKNVLFTTFYLASLIAYIRYLKRTSAGYYILSIVLFILSLLSKSMAIPLCVTIVLIDYYFGRKLLSRKVIFEKIPYFVFAAVFGVVAIYAQQSTWGEGLSQVHHSFTQRIIFAAYAFLMYAVRLMMPLNLSGFYPYPNEINSYIYLMSSVSLIIIGGIFYYVVKFHRRFRLQIFSLLFFIVNIFMLLKLFEVPAGDYYMADRYVYVASIGLFLLVGTGLDTLRKKGLRWKRIVSGGLVIYIFIISLQTLNRVRVFGNGERFYSDIISKYPDAKVAYTNRGAIYREEGRFKDALKDFNRAIKAGPAGYREYANRGFIYNDLEEFGKALKDFRKSLSEKPDNPSVLSGYGFAILHSGDYNGSIAVYTKVIKMQPANAEAWANRGTAKYSMGDLPGAIDDYSKALEIQPEYVTALFNRGLAYLNSNKPDKAVEDLTAVAGIDPAYTGVYSNLGVAYSRMGKPDLAFAQYDKAIEINPSDFEAHLNRGIDYYYSGQLDKAINDINRAIELNNGLGAARYFRGMIYLKTDPANACSEFREALKRGFQMASQQIKIHCK